MLILAAPLASKLCFRVSPSLAGPVRKLDRKRGWGWFLGRSAHWSDRWLELEGGITVVRLQAGDEHSAVLAAGDSSEKTGEANSTDAEHWLYRRKSDSTELQSENCVYRSCLQGVAVLRGQTESILYVEKCFARTPSHLVCLQPCGAC